MIRPSLFWKIFGSSSILILLTAVVAGYIAERRIVSDVERETRENLRTRVDLIEALVHDGLPDGIQADFQQEIRELGARIGTRVTIIRADGLVLADSSNDPAGMDDHSRRPEVLASRSGEFGTATRTSDTLGVRMVYVARTLRHEGVVVAYVRGALPLLNLQARLSLLRGLILGGAGFSILLGLLVAALMARRVARPLRGMRDAAAAIAAGDLERRVPVGSSDEVGDLARSFNDMAARLEREVSQIQSDQRGLRAILEGMLEGVIAVDADESVVLVNDAACEILGVDRATVGDRSSWDQGPVPAVAAILAQAVERGENQGSILRIPREGTERVVHVHASPLTGDDGEERGAVVVLNDFTEREQIEAIRRDFVANASHEIKTPIAAIRGLVETILDDAEMPAETRGGFLERVQRQVRRLGELVDEMLALSRLEVEDSPLVRRDVDLRGPLREVVDDERPLADEYGVVVETEIAEEPLRITAEPESLRRIAGNLMDNAIKYSGHGACVTLRAFRRDGEVVLEVSDDGPGIPAEKHGRIFERFYRVDEHRSREVGGTGLGLAIVKHLVQAHGGRIELESAAGRGSTFRVTFPAV